MIVLGLDPGIARTGYGVINTSLPNQFVQCGCITTLPIHSLEHRLADIGNDITSLIEIYKPDLAVVEEIFFGKNAKTAISTAHVRGVLLQILASHHVPIQTLTPPQIKSRLTGYGAATKSQIQHLIQRQLHLTAIPQPDDAADALAAALCGIETTL